MKNQTTITPGTGAERGPLLAVFLTVFIDLLGFGIVIPLLPIYSKAYGASDLSLGLLFASFSAMQLVFAPLWGRISDRVGRRLVLIIGLFGTSASYVLFAFADDMTMLFVSRMLAGFFGANVPIAQAYIADVTSPENRARGMGMIGAAFGLGFTVGPLVGGELVGLHYSAPGLAAAGFSLIAAIIGIRKLIEPHTHRMDENSRIFGFETVGHALREPRIGWIIVLYFLAILSFSGFETMFIRYGLARFPGSFGMDTALEQATMDQIYAAAPIAGRYMFFIGLVAALVQGGLIRRLVPRFGETRLIVIGPLLLGAAMLLIGVATSWSWVMAACVLMPFGFGVNNPSLNGLLSRAAPVERQGAYLGLNQSTGSLARVVGPAGAGFAFESLGPSSPFVLSAGLLVLATLMAAVYHRRFGTEFQPPSKTSA